METFKTVKRILPAMALLLGLSGCYFETQRPPIPGDVYVTLEPSEFYYVEQYWDNNAYVPEFYHWGEYYFTKPGTFQYEYSLGNGYVYWGNYTLYQDRGAPASNGYDVLDGVDRYYTFHLDAGGGWTEFSQFRSTNSDGAVVESLSDTVISYGNFEMLVTRNRTLKSDFQSDNTPKYVRDREKPEIVEKNN